MENWERFSAKERKDICAKEWRAENGNNLVTP